MIIKFIFLWTLEVQICFPYRIQPRNHFRYFIYFCKSITKTNDDPLSTIVSSTIAGWKPRISSERKEKERKEKKEREKTIRLWYSFGTHRAGNDCVRTKRAAGRRLLKAGNVAEGALRVLANRNYNRVTAARQYIKDRIMSFSCQKGGATRGERRCASAEFRVTWKGGAKERERSVPERGDRGERKRGASFEPLCILIKIPGAARRSSPRRENRRAIKKATGDKEESSGVRVMRLR